MLSRGQNGRDIMQMVWFEDLVPKEHLLRKIDAAVNFDKIYEMVEELYCEDNGRPSIDPVVLVKMVLIQHLYGLPSLRRTAAEVEVNMAYRWFLGNSLQDETPHFSTLSYNFKTLPEFDVTKKWWSEEYYEECNFGGKFFFAVGDIAHSMYEQLEVIFVNETLYTANHIGENGNIDALYDLVRDGKWTWETFKKYVSDFTAENVGGEDATYGLALNLHSFRALHKGLDVQFTYRDNDNKVNFYQTLPERTVNVYDAMQSLIIDNQNVLCNKTFSHEAETQNKMFERGDLLFYGQMLGQATQLREMSDVKGVLPYPKFDDLQESYYTTSANSVSAIMVPRNIAPDSAEMVGVVVEALSMYGYHEVTPKYYEDTLTYQVIGTQNGMDMLNIIRDSYTMDFALAYTMAFGDDHAYAAFYKAFFDGANLLSSTWKGYYGGLKGTLTGLYAIVNNQYK